MHDQDMRLQLKKCYDLLRKKQAVDKVVKIADKEIKEGLAVTDEVSRRRVLSWIALKYDAMLQREFNRDIAIEYRNELNRFMKHYPEYTNAQDDHMVIKRVIECLGKIEYGCWINNLSPVARNELVDAIQIIADNLKFYMTTDFDTEYDERSAMWPIFIGNMMFYSRLANKPFCDVFEWRQNLLAHWKHQKFKNYGYTEEEIRNELKVDKFDFIWR